MGLWNDIVNAGAFLYSLVSLVLGTIADVISVIANVFVQVFFSGVGVLLLSLLLLWGLGAVWTETQGEVFSALDQGYCKTADARNFLADLFDEIANLIEIWICFYNLMVSWAGQLIIVFFELTIGCDDGDAGLLWLESLGKVLLAIAEALLGWFEDPFHRSIPFFSPQGAAAADFPFIEPDMKDIWHPIKDVVNATRPLFACLCEETLLNDLFNFLLDRIEDDYLGCTIDRLINSALELAQQIVNIILDSQVPDFTGGFGILCQSFVCAGQWVDNNNEAILELFLGGDAFDLQLGCIASRIICVLIEAVSVLVDIVVNLIDTGDIADTIAAANFTGLIERMYQLADCVEALFGLVDVCLGETVGNLVRLLPAVTEFTVRAIQEGEFYFELLFDAVFALVGNSRLDVAGASGVAGNHLEEDPECAPNCVHDDSMQQTSLTCLIAKILGNTECSQAFADLTNAVVQALLTPVLLLQEVLTTDYSSLSFSGNPLASGSLDSFNDLILNIICVVTDRLILLLDYTGHVVECIPGLGGLGDAIVQASQALFDTIDDVKRLTLLAVEVVVQIFIWILTLFDASPFGGDAGDELLNFFTLFSTFFLEVFDLFLEIVKGLVDFVLFPWFPGIFGQGTLLSDDPGTARFTQCFEEFGDCICGITKTLADNICLPLSIGCLSGLWPDCDDFEPERRRQFLNATIVGYTDDGIPIVGYREDGRPLLMPAQADVFTYWAEQHRDSYCGEVFARWGEAGMLNFTNPITGVQDTSVGEQDGMELLNCISMVRASAVATANTTAPPDLLINPKKIGDAGRQFGYASAIFIATESANVFSMYADPAAALGRPEANASYVRLESALADLGVNNTVAINGVLMMRDTLYNVTDRVMTALNSSNASASDLAGQSVATIYKAGQLANRAISVGIMTLQRMQARSVMTKLRDGVAEAGQYLWGTAARNAKIREEQARVKREYTAGAPNWSMLDRLRNGYWFTHVTKKDMRMHKLRRWWHAITEYSAHVTGGETMMPKRDARGDVMLDDHKPDSCTVVMTECDDNLGNGCASQETFIANFRVCNDVFGHALVTNCQSTENYADFNFVTFDYYIELEDCQLPNSERPPPDGNICAFGPSPDLNATEIETQIPNLDPNFCGFGVPPNPNVTDFDVTCWDTSEPPSTDNGAGFICITQYGCTACPVDQVIPGFECSYLDNVVHRLEFLTRRCIDKFGLGPPLPEIPSNLSEWFFENIIIDEDNVTRMASCGNYRVEDNITYSYRNPVTRELFEFPGEQCDPPGSFAEVLLPDINGTMMLVNATCGVACQWTRCGNGILEMNEECDDGNNLNGDGCNSLCMIEACGDGNIDSGSICRTARSNGFFGRPCVMPIKICVSGDNMGASCAFQNECINSPDKVPCQAKVVLECVGGPMGGVDCEFKAPGFCGNGTCDDVNLEICGGEPSLCEPREQCDDGNILGNDGCDRNCMFEKCPQIVYTDFVLDGDPVPCPGNGFGNLLQGAIPETCFHLPPNDDLTDPTGAIYSVELNCKAGDLVLWTYENPICDGRGIENRVKETLITDECRTDGSGQDIVCTQQLFIPGVDCFFAVQTGIEFTCTENCAFCGDGIVNGDEDCDDGSRFLTGDPVQDMCVNCRTACTCAADPHLACVGQCIGGVTNGDACNPRAGTTACVAVGNQTAICVPVQCCGDNIISGGEDTDVRCDRIAPPPIDEYIGQTCVNCLVAECECQANKTCQGVCKRFAIDGGVRTIVASITTPFPILIPVACDMELEPFACPDEDSHCVPQYCCGDGDLQLDYENVGPNDVPDPCDPSTPVPCATPDADTCGYLRPEDDLTMLFALCSEDDDILGLGALAFGRRDACTCQLGAPCIGVCYTQYGDMISPSEPYFCEREGLTNLVTPYDTLGWTRTALGNDPTAGNAQCEAYGFPGAICGAVACCGNSPLAETMLNAADLFADPRRNSPCDYGHKRAEPEAPYESEDNADGPCEFGSGLMVDPLGCGIAGCQYDSRWFGYADECTCQPGLPCVGRCSRRGDHTDMLCDPNDASNSPWCPYDSDADYACVAVACCGDGVNQTVQGVDAPSNSAYGPLVQVKLEDCDDSLCVPQQDCGLDENVFDLGAYTQCECLDGFDCGGACVDTQGHFQPSFLVTDGPHCDATVDGGSQGPCDPGYTCVPQACCGDAYQHRWESCDSCDNTCGLVLPMAKRRRSVEFESEWERAWEENAPVAGGILDARQAPPLVVEMDRHGVYNMNGPPLKEDVLGQWIIDLWNQIFDAIGFVTTGALTDRLRTFFGSCNIDVGVPPAQRDICWYAVFPFLCRAPESTSCELGLGLVDGIIALLLYSGLFLAGVAFATQVLGSLVTGWVLILYIAIAFPLFMGVTFGYPVPGCLFPAPRLPECIGHEIADVFARLNETCAYFPDGVVIEPPDGSCPEDCERNITDCKAIGFIDGFDSLMFTLEVYLPDVATAFRNSFLFSWLNGYEYFALTFARFDYGGDPPSSQDQWCYWVTILNLAAVPAVLLALGLGAYFIGSIIMRLLDRTAYVVVRGETFVRVWEEGRRHDEDATY